MSCKPLLQCSQPCLFPGENFSPEKPCTIHSLDRDCFHPNQFPTLKLSPTFLLGKPLGVVEKDYSFVSFFNNILVRCWGPQLREPRVWFYNYNHAAKVMVTIWAILVGFANHYFLVFPNSIYILLNNWNTYGQTGAELFCRMLGSWVYPWYLGRVKSCRER